MTCGISYFLPLFSSFRFFLTVEITSKYAYLLSALGFGIGVCICAYCIKFMTL